MQKRAALGTFLVAALVLAAMMLIRLTNDDSSVASRPSETGTPESDSAPTTTNKVGGALEAHEALRLVTEEVFGKPSRFTPENTRFHIERHKPSERWIIHLDWLAVVPDMEGWVAVDDAGNVTNLPYGGVRGEEFIEKWGKGENGGKKK